MNTKGYSGKNVLFCLNHNETVLNSCTALYSMISCLIKYLPGIHADQVLKKGNFAK